MTNESFYRNPPDCASVAAHIAALHERFDFLHVSELGKSVLGRPIHILQIGEPQECVLFVGAFHGMEWLTCSLLLRFIDDLCFALDNGYSLDDVDVRRALLGRGLTVIPCINPDGVEISLYGEDSALSLCDCVREISKGDTLHWQANARGVDLNHNFDAGWHVLRHLESTAGINAPAITRFGGTAPESEPESHLLASLCRSHPFRHALAFHSQGEEIYWRYGAHLPPRSVLMTRILAAVSGYKPAAANGLASHGGFKDWFIQEFHRPAFTIEIGKGHNPLPITDLRPIYAKLREMLLLAAIL